MSVCLLQSPWGSVAPAAPACSLVDVMSEQLARQLDEENSSIPTVAEYVVIFLFTRLPVCFDDIIGKTLLSHLHNLKKQPNTEVIYSPEIKDVTTVL